mmetsp:Transcript_15832/g.44388  ORF Transcript_15832/g.44388 Transcript_15832/m.44388 type:complete len:84 (+) Transcript_15832:553-804(+)
MHPNPKATPHATMTKLIKATVEGTPILMRSFLELIVEAADGRCRLTLSSAADDDVDDDVDEQDEASLLLFFDSPVDTKRNLGG